MSIFDYQLTRKGWLFFGTIFLILITTILVIAVLI